ncbi:MAG: alpha/beta hydrolase [Streptosporangiales bacterium]
MVLFGLLAWWMMKARQPVLRLLAACLAFLPAVAFGVVAVNKYYGYYQTWSAAVADFGGQGAVTGSPMSTISSRGQIAQLTKSQSDLHLAQQQGYTVRMTVAGKLSHITRAVYTYLPPQYFQPAYKNYRFPVMELIHGQPGVPQDWINLLDVNAVLNLLVTQRRAKPVVLVMPDANGADNISLQCLNQVGGPQDLTYLAQDLPDAIAGRLRVTPPGPSWAIAGYSEGGYCAANMALRFPARYGFAGVMSGYFSPLTNTLQHPYRVVSPFGGNRTVKAENTPLRELQVLPPTARIPYFWLGAGTGNKGDVAAAETFWQELALRQTDVPLDLTHGEGHNMGTWTREVPSMLAWMTPRMVEAAKKEAAASPQPGARHRAKAARRHRTAPGTSASLLPPAATPATGRTSSAATPRASHATPARTPAPAKS